MWRIARIRFGLGRFNTQAEVDYVAAKVIDVVKNLRKLSPLYEMVQEGIDLTKIQVGGALRSSFQLSARQLSGNNAEAGANKLKADG